MRYTVAALIVASFIALVIGRSLVTPEELHDVQSGKSVLWCHLHTGYQKIDPSNIKGLHTNGKWLFKDGGSASSCEVVKVND